MTTTTATTANVELDQYRTQTVVTDSQLAELSTFANGEDVAEASRVVDAGVPEGGYGWVALAGCGVICFFFVG